MGGDHAYQLQDPSKLFLKVYHDSGQGIHKIPDTCLLLWGSLTGLISSQLICRDQLNLGEGQPS